MQCGALRRALARSALLALLAVRPLAAAPELTPDEWQEIERGEVVVRRLESERRGELELARAIGVGTLPASPDLVWSVLTDFRTWPEFMPNLRETRIVRREESRVWLRNHFRIAFRDMRHTVVYTLDPGERRLAWTLDLDAPHDLAWVEGSWEIAPFRDTARSLVTYRIRTDPGAPVPGFIERALVVRSIPDLFRGLRNAIARRAASP